MWCMGKREVDRKIIGPTTLDIQGIYSDVIIVDSLHHFHYSMFYVLGCLGKFLYSYSWLQ